MMILYHGTTYYRFNRILNCKSIKVTSDELTHYRKTGYYSTQNGYVYLTDNEYAALDFANRCFSDDECDSNCRLLIVLKIQIDNDKVTLDDFENTEKTSKINNVSYKSSKNISIENIKQIAFFQFSSFQKCCEFYGKQNHFEWSDMTFCQKIWNGDLNIM